MDGELKALVAREAIRNCIVRLARGEDRRDAEMITSAYWPDSVTDYGVFAGDFDAYLAWVVPGSPAIPVTQHVLGQTHVEFEQETAHIESARCETQVISYHRVNMGEAEHDTIVGGRYLDVMQKRGSEWRIAERTMLYDWHQDFGPANDFSKGVMGLAFSAAHFSGRAHGDFSEVFFGKGRPVRPSPFGSGQST